MTSETGVSAWYVEKYDPSTQLLEIGTCKCDSPSIAFASTVQLPDDMSVHCSTCPNKHYWKDIALADPLARLGGRRPTAKKLMINTINTVREFLEDQAHVQDEPEDSVQQDTSQDASDIMSYVEPQTFDTPVSDVSLWQPGRATVQSNEMSLVQRERTGSPPGEIDHGESGNLPLVLMCPKPGCSVWQKRRAIISALLTASKYVLYISVPTLMYSLALLEA